ncbi:MAG: hypothetical protein ACP5N7_07070 [Candidatus Pacearchaeota archaeon]
MNTKQLLILGGIIDLFFFGSSVYKAFDGGLQKLINGPEYCFEDISQSEISVAAQGVEVKYTQTEGDRLCFRTKDYSIVERLNQQIQDRKLQEELARIQASDRFWNETFPFIFLVGSIVLVIIFIILYFSNRNNGRYY